jgi:hypothetical protein
MKRGEITVRPFNPAQKKADFQLLKDVYNSAWEKNWGFVPLTPRELDALVHSLGQFLDTKLAFFAFVNGEPAGVIVAIWDFNQVLQKAQARPGTPELFTLLKALYYWKLRPVMDWVRVPLMGVKEQYRGKGVDVVMYYYVMDAAIRGGCVHSDSGWILATNKGASSITLNAGGRIHRTYRYFDKALA